MRHISSHKTENLIESWLYRVIMDAYDAYAHLSVVLTEATNHLTFQRDVSCMFISDILIQNFQTVLNLYFHILHFVVLKNVFRC